MNHPSLKEKQNFLRKVREKNDLPQGRLSFFLDILRLSIS